MSYLQNNLMYKYLFICNENIGRSQMAEAFCNHKFNGIVSISAGIINSSHKYGGYPRPDVIQVMREIGINVSKQKIKKVSKKLLEKAEEIIVLCDKEKCPDIITVRKNVLYIKVDDPPDSKKTLTVIRKMRDEINEIVENL